MPALITTLIVHWQRFEKPPVRLLGQFASKQRQGGGGGGSKSHDQLRKQPCPYMDKL